jgi:hypothetical protein
MNDIEKIKTVYEKYKHLDSILSNEKLANCQFEHYILYDLWKVIKELQPKITINKTKSNG